MFSCPANLSPVFRLLASSFSLLVQRKRTKRKDTPAARCFLRFSAQPGVGERVHPRRQRRPSLACPFGLFLPAPAMLGRAKGIRLRLVGLTPTLLGDSGNRGWRVLARVGVARRAVSYSPLYPSRCGGWPLGSIALDGRLSVAATGKWHQRDPWRLLIATEKDG